jgi:hypothetical protein
MELENKYMYRFCMKYLFVDVSTFGQEPWKLASLRV